MKTIQLTDEQLSVLHEALMLLPYGRVAPLVATIGQQLAIAAAREAKATPAAEPAMSPTAEHLAAASN